MDSAIEEIQTSSDDYLTEMQRMVQLQGDLLDNESKDSVLCNLCGEAGADLRCLYCERFCHPLCLRPPALTIRDVPGDAAWCCPCCGEKNKVC